MTKRATMIDRELTNPNYPEGIRVDEPTDADIYYFRPMYPRHNFTYRIVVGYGSVSVFDVTEPGNHRRLDTFDQYPDGYERAVATADIAASNRYVDGVRWVDDGTVS